MELSPGNMLYAYLGCKQPYQEMDYICTSLHNLLVQRMTHYSHNEMKQGKPPGLMIMKDKNMSFILCYC